MAEVAMTISPVVHLAMRFSAMPVMTPSMVAAGMIVFSEARARTDYTAALATTFLRAADSTTSYMVALATMC
ncbi:hypothetical protein BHK69_28995 [Bosea vaviloviae]|uniref:Uncharacterized protein n=1 Tax=Bosea vaviloviae TaxID=1526658 RepID=A0A1D7U996_9HYPH|nr:hypothetical protein BHK69_28995 [Bosea vaviloviae]